MYTREEYENLINNSPLFEIDKESSPMLYKTERYNLLTHLADYYRFFIYPNKPLDFYSMTLILTADECIRYYKRERGEFLHLFNSAMKRDLHIAKAKEIVEEERHGIKVSKEDDKLIRKVIAFANSKGLDICDPITQDKISKALNIDVVKMKDLVDTNNNAVAVSSTVINEDGDEIELFDQQTDLTSKVEEEVVNESSFIVLLENIDSVFATVQERQKKLLSMLLTVEIIKALDYDIVKAKKLAGNKKMFNAEMIDYYKMKGELPTARQIAAMCGVSEQSLSRTYHNFKIKIGEKC